MPITIDVSVWNDLPTWANTNSWIRPVSHDHSIMAVGDGYTEMRIDLYSFRRTLKNEKISLQRTDFVPWKQWMTFFFFDFLGFFSFL